MSREVLSVLDRAEREEIRFLEWLVNQDSGTYDRADVNQVGAILAEFVTDLGFAVTRFPQEKVGDHLLCEKPGTGPKRFLFVSHLDTVYPAGTAKERPFRVEGLRAYGPAVIDMKGGITAMLFAFRGLKAIGAKAWAETNLRIVFNSDEEILSPTSRGLIQEQARWAHSVGVTEPARPHGEYVRARKGAGKFYLEVTGKAAHAGAQPELGASALWDVAQKVCALHTLTDFARGTTVNVGVIRGGERSNVVCDRCYAEIDLRARTPADADQAIAAMRQICEAVHVPGTQPRFWGELSFPPWSEGDPGTARLLAILGEAGKEIGLEVKAILTGGGSDGNHTSQVAPTIDGMGPQGSGTHSPNEFMELPTLLERTKMIALFLEHWHATFQP